MKRITVKIQRPIITNGDYDTLLIYDKRRLFEGTVQMDRETLMSLFPDGGHKNFARGFLKGDKFHIEYLVDPSDWPTW